MSTKPFTDTTGQLPVSFTLIGEYLSAFEAVRAAIVATNPGVSPPAQGVIQEAPFADKVEWGYGIVLGLGSGLGGYVASRAGARVGERLIRAVLAILVPLLALRLLLV